MANELLLLYIACGEHSNGFVMGTLRLVECSLFIIALLVVTNERWSLIVMKGFCVEFMVFLNMAE